jgi:hypothetical protein
MVRCWGEFRGVSKGELTMPRNKDLKRLVRARMRKTGEAYTAALAHINNRKPKRVAVTAAAAAVRTTPDSASQSLKYAAVAGMSDEKLKAKTGCSWERWVHALDRHGAGQMSHREIVALVSTKYKVDSWWSQTVTVGYERIKGLRARGQRRDGTYEASKSRTFNVPVTTLYDAWSDAVARHRWLDGTKVKVRTATAPKSMRLDWDDRSIIAVGFTAKGKSKSSVAVQHTKLPDRQTADQVKKYWSDKLDALGGVLSSAGPTRK